MKKAALLLLCTLIVISFLSCETYSIKHIDKEKVESMVFLNTSKPSSQNYIEWYSSDDKNIIKQFISELQILKKKEIGYFGSSYGVPTLKFRTIEDGKIGRYKQIPIKEMKSTIQYYQSLFSKKVLLECTVDKGSRLKELVDYLDRKDYKYYPFNEDLTYEEPYYLIWLDFFKSRDKKSCMEEAISFFQENCENLQMNEYKIEIPDGIRCYDAEGRRIYEARIEIITESIETCEIIKDITAKIGKQAFIHEHLNINMFIEDSFFTDESYKNLFSDIITLIEKID